jgi:predicted MFS family arabinose efflux permease
MRITRFLTPIGLLAAFLLGTAYGSYAGGPPPDQWNWLDTLFLVALIIVVAVSLIAAALVKVRHRQNDPFPLGRP